MTQIQSYGMQRDSSFNTSLISFSWKESENLQLVGYTLLLKDEIMSRQNIMSMLCTYLILMSYRRELKQFFSSSAYFDRRTYIYFCLITNSSGNSKKYKLKHYLSINMYMEILCKIHL